MKSMLLVKPHGFCSGVARAVRMAEATLAEHPGKPLYCLHELVHNRQVVEQLRERGTVFVKALAEVPEGGRVLFSAHGVAPAIRAEAKARNLAVVDATCPFVEKVHLEVRLFAKQGCAIVCIGHAAHAEVIGVCGEAPDATFPVDSPEAAEALVLPEGKPVAAVSQTTISGEMHDNVMAVLMRRFPDLRTPNRTDICYATRNRQEAVRRLAGVSDFIIVLGSSTSSNSRRLVETAESAGCRAALVDSEAALAALPLDEPGIKTVGITSGASTPEYFFERIVALLRQRGDFDSPRILDAGGA